MDDSDHGALVVIGSGPGVGSHIAARFAREGFRKIILMSRDEARLKVDAATIRMAALNTDIDTVPVDLTMTVSVRRALIEVERRLDGMRLECIVFNAARVATGEILSWPVEELQRDLHVTLHPHTVNAIGTNVCLSRKDHSCKPLHCRAVGFPSTSRTCRIRTIQALIARHKWINMPGPNSRALLPVGMQGRAAQSGHELLPGVRPQGHTLRTCGCRRTSEGAFPTLQCYGDSSQDMGLIRSGEGCLEVGDHINAS